MIVRFPLPKAIDADLATDIEKQAVYASTAVQRVRVVDAGRVVEIEADDGADRAQLEPRMAKLLDEMVKQHRRPERKVLRQNSRRDGAPLERGVYQELKRRGWVLDLGRGQVGLAGPALAL